MRRLEFSTRNGDDGCPRGRLLKRPQYHHLLSVLRGGAVGQLIPYTHCPFPRPGLGAHLVPGGVGGSWGAGLTPTPSDGVTAEELEIVQEGGRSLGWDGTTGWDRESVKHSFGAPIHPKCFLLGWGVGTELWENRSSG